MTDLLIVIRNVVLAAILGWIGLEFAPDATDKDEKPSEQSYAMAILG
jgi:hypothetical protein